MFPKLLRYQRLQTPASLISSFISFFVFSSYTADSQRSIPAWSSRREHRSGQTIVRRRFLFLPPAVESGLFCSRRHLSKGIFRELAAVPFASPIAISVSTVCICCKMNSGSCAPRSWLSAYRQKLSIDELCRDFRHLFSSLGCGHLSRTWAVVRWLTTCTAAAIWTRAATCALRVNNSC